MRRSIRSSRRSRGGLAAVGALFATPAILAAYAVVGLSSNGDGADYSLTAGAGHGRGLGQNGAHAYAQAGWSAEQIIGRYYPDATLGTTAVDRLKVRLMSRDNDVLEVSSASGMTVGGQTIDAGQAVRLMATASGADVEVLSECGGTELASSHSDDVFVRPINDTANRPAAELLTMCDDSTAYRGALGVARDGAALRIVNDVNVDDYLRGVVPVEMSAGWGSDGGMEALRAQAIAARSYALAEDRYDYAQTCDTTSCQAYSGTDREDERTDQAVSSTSGMVLLEDGNVMRSEYSANSSIDDDLSDIPAPPAVSTPPLKDLIGPDSLAGPDSPQAPLAGADKAELTNLAQKVANIVDQAADSGSVDVLSDVLSDPAAPDAAAPAPLANLDSSMDGLSGGLAELVEQLIEAFTKASGLVPVSGTASDLTLTATSESADLLNAIDAKYAELGGPTGMLGKSTSAPMVLLAGRLQVGLFERGVILAPLGFEPVVLTLPTA